MRKPKIKKQVIEKKDCYFCHSLTVPDYENPSLLSRFVSTRGGVLPRRKSGNCAKHQRILNREIKRARHLALLPFINQPER